MRGILDLNGGIFFLQNIDDVYLSYRSKMTVAIEVNSQTVFSETLYCEEDGVVYLRGLPDLIAPYSRAGVNSVLIAYADDSVRFEVFYSTGLVSGDDADNAARYLNHNFLSSVTQKRTTLSSVERLAAAGDNQDTMLYRCLFSANGVKHVVSGRFSAPPVVSTQDGYTIYNVSPMKMSVYGNGEQLLGYTVTLGNREMTYLIAPSGGTRYLRFSFVNMFGIEETVTIPGVINSARTVERTEAYHFGKRISVNPKLDVVHKVKSAVLTNQEMSLLSELVISELIRLYTDNDDQIDVVLADNPKIEPSTDGTKYNSAEFSFRYADNRRFGKADIHRSRIFDDSFDETYE